MSWLENVLLMLGILERVKDTESSAGQLDKMIQADKHTIRAIENGTSGLETRIDSYKAKKQEDNQEELAIETNSCKMLFESLDPIVSLLLQEIGEAQWGENKFLQQVNAPDFKWHLWKSDSVFLNSEYWIVQLVPTEPIHFSVKCAGQPIVTSNISRSELESALAKAVEAGPVKTNVVSMIWH